MRLLLEGGPAHGQALSCDGQPPVEVALPHSGWTHYYETALPRSEWLGVTEAEGVARMALLSPTPPTDVTYKHNAMRTAPLAAPTAEYETPALARERLRSQGAEPWPPAGPGKGDVPGGRLG